jgi:hypothetical protein
MLLTAIAQFVALLVASVLTGKRAAHDLEGVVEAKAAPP